MIDSGIFLDSANLEELRNWYGTGILGGATTNPVILQKEGITNLPEHIQKMVNIVDPGFPISIELPDSEMPLIDMVELAEQYGDMFEFNAVIKVPMDSKEPCKPYEVMRILTDRKIIVNATIGLTSGQLIMACEALRDADESYVSLFWGRCEEAGLNPLVVIKTFLKYREVHGLKSKLIVGSIRNTEQIDKAFLAGADIVTIKPELLKEWITTQRGVETVNEFNNAYRSVKDKIKL